MEIAGFNHSAFSTISITESTTDSSTTDISTLTDQLERIDLMAYPRSVTDDPALRNANRGILERRPYNVGHNPHQVPPSPTSATEFPVPPPVGHLRRQRTHFGSRDLTTEMMAQSMRLMDLIIDQQRYINYLQDRLAENNNENNDDI